MPDIQLSYWGKNKLAGSKPRQMKRYLIHDKTLDNIWECSAKSETNAFILCNLNPDTCNIVCIGQQPVLSRAVNHGKYTDLWTADKSLRR